MKSRVSYLRGLVKGMEISEKSQEGKVIREVVNVLDDFADAYEEIDMDLAELEERADGLDLDLGILENDVYGTPEETMYEEDQLTCPQCQEIVIFDENLLNNDNMNEKNERTEILCPKCSSVIQVFEGIQHDGRKNWAKNPGI